jgi:two-component system OmpR family response regulator
VGRLSGAQAVDDNVDAADTLAIVLRLEGHDVRSVYSGQDAIELVTSFAADVVLLDIGLPEMDGYETARRIRQLPGAASPRLVALTGYGELEDRQRALTSGFDHHLIKPVDPEALAGALVSRRQK